MTQIILDIKSCKECPAFNTTNHYSTDGWDRMEDWVCKDADNRKIQGAVEWHEESKIQIPEWCPKRLIK